jgi:hypothetical protein
LLACHLETPVETPGMMMDLAEAYFRILFAADNSRYFWLPSMRSTYGSITFPQWLVNATSLIRKRQGSLNGNQLPLLVVSTPTSPLLHRSSVGYGNSRHIQTLPTI